MQTAKPRPKLLIKKLAQAVASRAPRKLTLSSPPASMSTAGFLPPIADYTQEMMVGSKPTREQNRDAGLRGASGASLRTVAQAARRLFLYHLAKRSHSPLQGCRIGVVRSMLKVAKGATLHRSGDRIRAVSQSPFRAERDCRVTLCEALERSGSPARDAGHEPHLKRGDLRSNPCLNVAEERALCLTPLGSSGMPSIRLADGFRTMQVATSLARRSEWTF